MSSRPWVLGLALLTLAGCGSRAEFGAEAAAAPTTAPLLIPATTAAVPPAGIDDTVIDAPPVTVDGGAVLVLGDSLTVGATDMGALQRRLQIAGFDDVDVIAEEGRDTAWGLEEIEDLESVPSIVVVELGTNRSADPEGFAAVVVDVVDALRSRGAERIAWLTPVFVSDDRYADKIEVLEATDGIDLVADWAEVVHDDPELIGRDGLHPTEPGYSRLARFLVVTAIEVADG